MDAFYKIIQTKNKQTRKDFDKEKINKYIDLLLDSSRKKRDEKDNDGNNSLKYYVQRHFAVKRFKDRYVLIDKKNIDNDNVIPYLYNEEIYDTLMSAHLNCIHGGVKKTFLQCKLHAANIKISHVKAFLSICKHCINKKEKRNKRKTHELTKKKIVSSGFGARGQVDLIDIQKILYDYKFTDKRCRYILNYQDHFTKFSFLRGLKDKKAQTILNTLKDIFLTIGAPKILQTDNGGEFVNDLLDKYLATCWPGLVRIKGAPYHPQSQGSVERANGDVKRMLASVLAIDNNDLNNSTSSNSSNIETTSPTFTKTGSLIISSSSSISTIIAYIQFKKNTSINRSLSTSPYKILFGVEPLVDHNNYIITESTK